MHIYKNYYISNNLDESQDAMFKKKKKLELKTIYTWQ